MNWVAVPVDPTEVTAEALYELGDKHRLVPENADLAIEHFRAMSSRCAMLRVDEEETGKEIAVVLFSDIVDGESATVDLVPRSEYFSPVDRRGNPIENPCYEKIKDALQPIFVKLIEGRDLRRLTAMVPKSRSRTFKALRECGFRKEGVMRQAIKLKGRDPEDLVIMGMLKAKE